MKCMPERVQDESARSEPAPQMIWPMLEMNRQEKK